MTDEAENIGGETAPVAAPEVQQQPDVEAKARQMGWRPKEEFRGDPEKHVDAAEFVRRGEEHIPILRDKVRKLETVADELRRSNKEFGEYHRQTIERERKKHEADIADLKATQAQAVANQDLPAYHAAQQQIERLEQTKPAPPPAPKQEAPSAPPEVREFRERNEWYDRDPELAAAAQAYHVALNSRDPNLPLADNLRKTEEHIKRMFPEKFGNARRASPPAVDGGGMQGGGGQPRKRGYSDLPGEAKAACDKWVKSGHLTRDEYLSSYQWD